VNLDIITDDQQGTLASVMSRARTYPDDSLHLKEGEIAEIFIQAGFEETSVKKIVQGIYHDINIRSSYLQQLEASRKHDTVKNENYKTDLQKRLNGYKNTPQIRTYQIVEDLNKFQKYLSKKSVPASNVLPLLALCVPFTKSENI
jgi:hypothetical protein